MNQKDATWGSRPIRIAVIAAAVLSVAVVVGGIFISRIRWDIECQNTILSESLSPDGTWKIVVFVRDCGATTGFATHASLLKANQALAPVAGNLYIADSNHGAAPVGPGGGPPLGIRWKNPRSVLLTSAPGARVFLGQRQIEDVQIEYAP